VTAPARCRGANGRMIRVPLSTVAAALALADATSARQARITYRIGDGALTRWKQARDLHGPDWPTTADIEAWDTYRTEHGARLDARAATLRRRRNHVYLTGGQGTTVSSLGARRRVQALCALGYTLADLATISGTSLSRFSQVARGHNPTVYLDTDARIRALYDRLSGQPPRPTWVTARARRLAIAKGWAPPLAWDNIDNPDERPQGVRTTHREDPAA